MVGLMFLLIFNYGWYIMITLDQSRNAFFHYQSLVVISTQRIEVNLYQ